MTNNTLVKSKIPKPRKKRKADEGYEISTLPYPIASIVIRDGRKYLVEKINYWGTEPRYALLGHSELGTQGRGIAWIDHAELSDPQLPTLETWGMLTWLWGIDREDE